MNANYWFKRLLKFTKKSIKTVKASRVSRSHGTSSINRASPAIDEPLDPDEFGYVIHMDDCQRLYKKILVQALIDYFTRGVPKTKNRQKQYNADLADAWDFLFSEEEDWKHQREIVCDHAGVDFDAFSEGVIKWRKEKLNLG